MTYYFTALLWIATQNVFEMMRLQITLRTRQKKFSSSRQFLVKISINSLWSGDRFKSIRSKALKNWMSPTNWTFKWQGVRKPLAALNSEEAWKRKNNHRSVTNLAVSFPRFDFSGLTNEIPDWTDQSDKSLRCWVKLVREALATRFAPLVRSFAWGRYYIPTNTTTLCQNAFWFKFVLSLGNRDNWKT